MINLIKRNKQSIAYIVLAAFVAFAFAQQQTQNNRQTQRLKSNTEYVLIQSCMRGNYLRYSINTVVLSELPLVKSQAKKKVITKAQEQITLNKINQVAGEFDPVNCKATSNLNQTKIK